MEYKAAWESAPEEKEETDHDTQENADETETDRQTDETTGLRLRPDIADSGSRAGVGGESPASLQRSPAAGNEVQASGNEYVDYDHGPDRGALSKRLGIDVQENEARRLQRLEDDFGTDAVRDWASEGMTADTMGKPRDMQAFRERQAGRSDEIPSDIERQNQASLQRNAGPQDDTSAGETAAPDAVREVISSPGHSLDEPVQREMESKMGDSFDDVRVHTGPQAAAAADQIQARAFTVGNHVAFNRGEYQPNTDSGKKILAHELTHVRQQADGRVSMLPKADAENPAGALGPGLSLQPKLEVSSPDDPAEKEAERVAEAVVQMDDATETADADSTQAESSGTADADSTQVDTPETDVSRSAVVQRAGAMQMGPSQVEQDPEELVGEIKHDDSADQEATIEQDAEMAGMSEAELTEFLEEGGEMPEGVPQGSDELVFNVHGYKNDVQGGLDNVSSVREEFDEFEGDVSGLGWDSSADIDINYWSLVFGLSGLGTEAVKEAYQSWKSAQERADEIGPKLAQFLLEYRSRPENRETRIILQGHSLGTRVVLEAIRVLDEAGQADIVDTVILLGGAVDTEEIADGRYTDAVSAVNEVHSYVNEGDWVLRFPFRAAEFLDEGKGISAIGKEFIGEDAPENYHEHDVSDELGWDHFFGDYFVDSSVSDDVQDVIRGEVDEEPEEEDEDDGSIWDWVWPKLEVSSPDDPAEKEADRVAEEVMRMPDAVSSGADTQTASTPSHTQRDVGLVRTVPVRRSADGAAASDGSEAKVQDVVQSSGKSLPDGTRSDFESKMGADFSSVDIHTGSAADEAARSINARAFTVGNNIAFAKGNYEPDTDSGQKLLAHELTHVVQQGEAGRMDRQVQREPVGETYTVQQGDTLAAIADRFGVSGGWEALYEANRNVISNPDALQPGMDLQIPQGDQSGGGSGSDGSSTYVVQQGDTLAGIADQLGVSGGWEALYEANRNVISDPNVLQPETEITIPGGEIDDVPDDSEDTPDSDDSDGDSNGDSGDDSDGSGGTSGDFIYDEEVSDAFVDGVREIASELDTEPHHLMAVMAYETDGTFDPAIENYAGSGATGLIQFMPGTAPGLGTSTEELAQMTAVEQLEYVHKYLADVRSWAGEFDSVGDVYMSVLLPAAVGEDDDYVLFSRHEPPEWVSDPSEHDHVLTYEQNSGLDVTGDGRVTKGEAVERVRGQLEADGQLERFDDLEAGGNGGDDEQDTDDEESDGDSGSESDSYTVQEGDTLGTIADQLSVPGGWEALYAANQDVIDNPDVIDPGLELQIPDSEEEVDETPEEDESGGGSAPSWVSTAMNEKGINEGGDLSRIESYWDSVDIGPYQYNESGGLNNWCGAFVSWVLEQSGKPGHGMGFRAREWKNYGQEIPTDEPRKGAIAVFARDGGGHVGFVVDIDESGAPVIIGGNQGNAVTIMTDDRPLLKYVIPPGVDPEDLEPLF